MIRFSCIIEDQNGMHARPAGMLVACVKNFDSSVRVEHGEKVADARRLLSLMTLGAKYQEMLTFEVEGSDEEDAALAIKRFMANGMRTV